MRFWPQKRWKKIVLTTLLVTLAVLVSLGGYLEYSVYREVTTQTEVLNADGAKTAIVYYHPGLTDFARNITYTYAQALAAGGWRVEVATASTQAPTDLSKYSLLVLSWAIYDFNPAPTITNQLHRIGNLNGMDTVIIAIGGGLDPLNAPANMNKTVQDANGTVVQSLTSYRAQHNQAELTEEAAKLKP
ncbi:MAG: flavodoxin family protein [Candidatus Bathyarchaeia archaeon]